MHFRTRLFTASVILVILPIAGFAIGLSEVMFDPSGNENTDEFVELYNDSAYAVNLTGWLLSDGEGADTIIATEQGLWAAPHQYVLILDPDYFSSGSTTYDSLVPENALVITISGSTIGSRGLSNSSPETVMLLNTQGDTVSSYTYSIGNLGGRSDEKILASGPNDSTNWADAVTLNGTPGARNSVTPPDHDLAIIRMEASPPMPRQGDSFSISVVVSNRGLTQLADSLLLMERWPVATGDSTRLLHAWQTGNLVSGDSQTFVQNDLVAASEPRYFVGRLTGNDDCPENNVRELVVSATGLVGSMVINEIMYSPDAGMSEWIELMNRSLSVIHLSGWSLGDGTSIVDTSRRFLLPTISLDPDSFLIVAADSSVLFEHVPTTAQIVVMNSGVVTLNNNGDSLLVWDQSDALIDRVDYRPYWGGAIGVSLERVSVASPSEDPVNWATSLDSTGGTPGRVNSRAIPLSNWSENILTLEPNPFSPNGDGRDDFLAIRVRLEQADSRLDLKVYDVRGREVRRLANNVPAGYSYELLWDGKDGQGRDLPTGLYIVYLEGLGKGGNRIQTARRVAALARPS